MPCRSSQIRQTSSDLASCTGGRYLGCMIGVDKIYKAVDRKLGDLHMFSSAQLISAQM